MKRIVKNIAFNLVIYLIVTFCLLIQYTEGVEFNFLAYNFFSYVLLRAIIYYFWEI